MRPTLRNLICMLPVLAFIGCGGFEEVKPPEKAPELTPEETQHMNDEMEKMRKMYEQK